MLRFTIGIIFLWLAVPSPGQLPTTALEQRARREYSERQFTAAERDFREVVRTDPSNIAAEMFLGQTLFNLEKYAESVPVYENARDLEASRHALSLEQRRILTDQLVMAYGITGQLKKAHGLADDAIRQDPDYPLNYYNLACALAEEGQKPQMLKNLELAFERKGNTLKGEHLPDPRADSSFQSYTRDSDFIALMKKLGYK
jgi:tetratricopeptide (TPR) repeat protein